MKSIHLLLAVAAVLLISCSSTRIVTVATNGDEINRRARAASTRIRLRDSSSGRVLTSFNAMNLRVGVDSTTWIDETTLQLRSTATWRLVSVDFSKGSGSLQGLGIGLLSGAIVGAAGGFIAGDDRPWQRSANGLGGWLPFEALDPRRTAGQKAIRYGTLIGLVGGLYGVLAGAAVERYERYVLLQATQAPAPN